MSLLPDRPEDFTRALEQRVLLVAPTSKDAALTRGMLAEAGIPCKDCETLWELCCEAQRGAAVLLLPEEALRAYELDPLLALLGRQPAWSDLPIILLTQGGADSPVARFASENLGNVTLLERPVRVATLVSAVRSALRARRRQYEVRQHLEELSHTQQKLAEAKEAAERANLAKDQFLAMLSHELRTPLMPVLLTASLLENHPDLPEDLHDEVRALRRNIELEARIIDDLLDLTRIAKGKLRFEFQIADAHDLIRNAADICSRGPGAPIRLSLKAARSIVRADPARLQQVFWNLLNNARKFTPPDGAITVRSRNMEDGRLVVEVIDTGVGIEPAFMPRAFSAFEQGETGHQRKGLGLGLAISKAIMDAHGGSIRAFSEGKGKGATFTVEIATVADPSTQTSVPGMAAPKRSGSTHPIRILLVEDHEATLKVLARLISGLGHQVCTARGVKEALEVAANSPVDLVLSDLGLPDGSGYALMRELKRQFGLKGIALSGYGMEEDVRKSGEAGFLEHLVKPVDLDRLDAAISRVAGTAPIARGLN